MIRAIRISSMVAVVALVASAVLLTEGYLSVSPDHPIPDDSWIGSLLSQLALAVLMMAILPAAIIARQNGQRGWYRGLALLVIAGVGGSYAVFALLISTAQTPIAAQYGFTYLVAYTLLPLVAAVGTMVYSFQPDPYPCRKWDRSDEDMRRL